MTGNRVRQGAPDKTGLFYGYIIVATAFLLVVLTLGTFYTFGVFFKPLIAEFGWTRAATSGAVSIAWIVSGFMSIVIGGLNDRLGPRIIITVCVLFMGIGYLLMSQVGAVWQLYLIYGLLIGVGLTFYIAVASTVVRWFVKRRTLMTGIVVSGAGIGALIAPPIASRLILAYDWSWSYIIIGSVYLVVAVSAAQLLKRDPSRIGQVAYGENEMIIENNKSVTDMSLKEAVHTRQFWMLFVVLICVGFTIHSIITHIVPHATDLGVSIIIGANILAIIGVASIMGEIVLGIVGDRFGNERAFAIGFFIMLLVLFWLMTIDKIWMFYIFAVIFGVAYGGLITQQAPMVARLFGLKSIGLILGLVGVGYTIGAASGPFLTGYIFDSTGHYRVAFMVGSAVSLLGLILVILLAPKKSK